MVADFALVVFDMAGTTIEDAGQVPAAFQAALAAHGLAVTADELRAVRGASKREAIRQLVERQRPPATAETDTRALADAIFTEFQASLSQLYRDDGIGTINGAADTFAWLRGRGIKVALNTGFDRMITGLILQTVGWRVGDMVDAVICGDDVRDGRPAPYLIYRAMEATDTRRVRAVVNVGDTALDLQAGDNAGVGLNIGVLSGAHGREQLAQAPHDHLLASVAALPCLLARLAEK